MKRPELNEIPLRDALELPRGVLIITMSEGQWDMLLERAYREDGAILLEVNKQEEPVRAYRRQAS